MHELQVTEHMLNIVLEHAERNGADRVRTVELQIGRLRDFEASWIQKYFDYLSRNTIAEGAALHIEWIPALLACRSCGKQSEIDLKQMDESGCAHCNSNNCTLISGTEYRVKNIGVT